MVSVKKPLRLFYSCAPEDASYRDRLGIHLSALVREGSITTWHHGRLTAGRKVREADEQLRLADIILLLVSPDFINSDWCNLEMNEALARQTRGEARVIPILLRSSSWKDTPLGGRVVLPDKCPVDEWPNPDQAWQKVVEGIKEVIEEVSPSMLTSHEPGNPSFPPAKMDIDPLGRNPFFTGREKFLLELHRQFQANGLPQAICGLGGLGKTQTALEYAFRYADEYQFISWIHADTENTLIADFVSLAKKLDLPEKDEQNQYDVVAAVKRWLTTHGRWLLIFDNADEPGIVSPFLDEAYNGYSLSTTSEGHILLTTRANPSSVKRQEIQKLDKQDAIQFLFTRTSLPATPENRRGFAEIVQEMDGLPLALDQAGAYIEESKCSPSEYLERYRQEKMILLRRRSEKTHPQYPESVATTWSLSFQKVEQNSPAAADLLRLCAFLDPDAIPLELIRTGSPYFAGPLQRIVINGYALDEAIKELLKFSLVRRNASERTLVIHRLVQLVLKETTLDSRMQRDWAKCVVSILAAAFPQVMRTDWARCQLYLPHALLCETFIRGYTLLIPEAISLLNSTGQYLQEHARYREAKRLLLYALNISKQSSGHDQSEIAMTLGNLADIYLMLGQYTQAEEHFKRALRLRQQIHGPDHPEVATLLDRLGTFYCKQGEYEIAETRYIAALKMRERLLGLEHLATAMTNDNLGMLYYLQARYKEAEQQYRKADAVKEKLSGDEHHDRATTLNNLGQLCVIQGRYREAASYYARALKMRRRVLGADHTATATTLDNLGTLYRIQGKYKEAEHHYKSARTIREKRLGSEHPEVATTLDNLGTLYRLQERYKEAEEFYEQARVIREGALDPKKHPEVATTLDNLGTLYRLQGKYQKAGEFYERARMIREDTLDPMHPEVATTLDNLGTLYRLQGQSSRAETFYRRSLAIRKKTLGSEHPDAADTLYNLAQFQQARDRRFYPQAEDYYRESLYIREKTLGIEHPDTVKTFEHLIYILQSSPLQNKRLQATSLQQSRQAYALCMQSSGSEHPDTSKAFEDYLQLLIQK